MRTFIIILAAFLILYTPVQASGPGYTRALDRINKINSYRPEQSPKHERAKEIFSDRVIDSTNRVVGEVNDVVLDMNGAISSLDVDFNRLRLGTDSMTINYRELGVRPVSNGYKMNYTDDQIVELVPELLAGIETAAGTQENTYSLRKTLGKTLYSADGRKLGKVDDVLFDSLGGRAELLFVSMTYRSLRGEKIAIPFAEPTYKKGKIIVKDDFADAMIDYARDQ